MSHLQTIDFSFTETGEGALLPASPSRMYRIAHRSCPPRIRSYCSIPPSMLLRPAPRTPFVPTDPRVAPRAREILTCKPPVSRRASPIPVPTRPSSACRAASIPRSPCSSRCAPSICWGAPHGRPCGVHARLRHDGPHQVQRRAPGRAAGRRLRTIAIGEAVRAHFADIGHDPSVTDVTYENAQARERTQVLMDLPTSSAASDRHGDLSELALGWATYNADHMSMYGVNAGVKTLVRHLVSHAADSLGGGGRHPARHPDTRVSPELLPPGGDGEIAQCTGELVGPYELHDFFLFHMMRYGFAPGKIYRMACRTFAELDSDGRPPTSLRRSCIGCARSTAGSSPSSSSAAAAGRPQGRFREREPRGDWRMPSDASAALWLEEVDSLIEAPTSFASHPAGGTGLFHCRAG